MVARETHQDVGVTATHAEVMRAFSLLTPPELAQAAPTRLARVVNMAAARLPGLHRDVPLYVSAFRFGFHAIESDPLRRVVVGRLLPGTRVQVRVAVRLIGDARVTRVGMDIAFVGQGLVSGSVAAGFGRSLRPIASAVARAWLDALAARLQATGASSQSATARASPVGCQAP